MKRKHAIWLVVLTSIYLCVELAFNARLLDVVGSAPDADTVHHIEIFGRSLSGTAVALLVLQLMLKRRAASQWRSPGLFRIGLTCLGAAGLVYMGIQSLVDSLVRQATPEMRRASMSIVLVQRALVGGQVQLDGLDDDPRLFQRPEGKAFLALFPAMAVSVERLDDKIRDVKLELLSRAVSDKLKGPKGFYVHYEKAVTETRSQWTRYQQAKGPADPDEEIARQQEKAWNDYLSDLGQRGWTPSTVPGYAQDAVRRKVRGRAPVPADWALNDEATFREAVAQQVRRRMGGARDGIKAGGIALPPGLGWEAFFAHAGVQSELRKKLGLPAGVKLLPAYATGEAFEQGVFAPMVRELARKELVAYEAPVKAFEPGGAYVKEGESAARAVIVPPVALFFSLMGAVGHMAKLLYLLVWLGLSFSPRKAPVPRLWLVPVGVLASAVVVLSVATNGVTESRLYAYMHDQVKASSGDSLGAKVKATGLTVALHWVAVGQGYGYPVNEWVRVRILNGYEFGHEEAKR